jgi:hypothetical protein
MIQNNIRAGLVIFSANNSGFYSVAGNDVVAFEKLQQIPTDVIFISNSKSAIIGFSNIKKLISSAQASNPLSRLKV